ncbi:50S ribosomal protein L18 [Patescibacteria group bacterium]
MKVKLRKTNKERRELRVRKKISGTAKIPRISIFKSNKYVYAQLIDDVKGKTLVTVKGSGNMEGGLKVGEELAAEAKKKKIKDVVFDRSGYKYHGVVKNVAEGARKGGLKL